MGLLLPDSTSWLQHRGSRQEGRLIPEVPTAYWGGDRHRGVEGKQSMRLWVDCTSTGTTPFHAAFATGYQAAPGGYHEAEADNGAS